MRGPLKHWPVVEPGMLMTQVDSTILSWVGSRSLTDASFEVYLREFQLDLESRGDGRVTYLLHVEDGPGINAKQRGQVSAILERYRAVLRRTTLGFSYVTSSAVSRGALRAIFWVAPPPYPYQVTASVADGLRFLEEKDPRVDPGSVEPRYRSQLQRFREKLGRS